MASVRERVGATGKTTWAVLYRHGKRQASKTFESPAAAEKFRTLVDQFGADEALELLTAKAPRKRGLTLDELAEKWLADKEGAVTPNIHRGYRRDYDNWISPWLGYREAASINEADVQRLVDHMKKPKAKGGGGLSPKSVGDRHAILHQIYKWASAKSRSAETGISHNPCKETDLPKRVKKPPKGLRIAELHALLEAGAKVDQDTADIVAFMAGTGWRISEAIALTAGAVEDDGTAVFVTMDRVQRRMVGFTEGGKSSASVGRRLRVLGPAVAVLRRRVIGKGPGDLVFTYRNARYPHLDPQPWTQTTLRHRRWPELVKAAGLADRAPTPHWLRHTHVAICHAAGLSLAEIQRRLGHEDIQTTINIYGRMIDDMNEEAAARLDALLTPQPAAQQVVEGQVVAGEIS